MDRFGNILGHIERDKVIQPFGKILRNLFHRLFHLGGHLHRIGPRKHIDPQDRRIAAVQPAFGAVRRRFERDPRNVAHANERTVGIGPDHNLFEIAY